MTPQLEEAERFLRLAKRDQAAFAALLNAAAVDPAVACFHAQQAAEKAAVDQHVVFGQGRRVTDVTLDDL